jgi:hypothetical protein
MIITVAKIGTGSEIDPIRPDTNAKDWQKISETETTMTIEILDKL